MSKSEQETTSKSIVRKRRVRRKTYWCAPRKVRSITMVDAVDNNPLVENKKSKKKHNSKRKQKSIKKLRRIDILAQPKTVKINPEHKSRVTNVNVSARKVWRPPVSKNQKSYIYSRKRARIKKVKTNVNVPKNHKTSSVSKKGYPQIALPKNIDDRLLSLVKKRLREITTDLKSV